MKLHIETGDTVTADNERVEGNSVRFVTEDGRTMFEVSAGTDGRSLEVRAVDSTRVNGEVFDARLEVLPNVTNSITVRTRRNENS